MNLTESEFDALLRRALIDVIHEDYADILEGEPDVPPHTEKYLRRKRKLLADPIGYVKRLARPVWKKALRMVACILLALATLFGTVMAVSPSARAWVVRMYIEWREDSTKFTFFGSQNQDYVSSNWYPEYIPDGFGEDEVNVTGNVTRVTFKDPAGNEIFFRYCSLHYKASFNVDNEHTNPKSITISDNPATFYLTNDDNYQSHLTWMDESDDTAFMLSGFVGEKELVKIAESVTKVF